jgi:hypothetical protein
VLDGGERSPLRGGSGPVSGEALEHDRLGAAPGRHQNALCRPGTPAAGQARNLTNRHRAIDDRQDHLPPALTERGLSNFLVHRLII